MSAVEGYKLPIAIQGKYFKDRFDALKRYTGAFEQMLQEPMMFDDQHRLPLDELLQQLVMTSEVLVCVDGDDIVGVAIFYDVCVTHSAHFGGWVSPKYRQGFSNQKLVREFLCDNVMDYAWNDLKLIRVESKVAHENVSAHSFARHAGFDSVGYLTMEMAFFGRLCDSVIYEAVNPAYVISPVEERAHGWRREQQGSDTASESVSGSTSPEHGDDSGGEFALEYAAGGADDSLTESVGLGGYW